MGYLIKMNRILFKKLAIFVFIIMLFSVSFVHATHNNTLSSRQNYDKKIDIEIAKKIANWKLFESDKANFYFIDNYDIIIDDDTDIVLFYIFHIDPQGFIITSSNYNLPPIIAYSFNSNFEIKDNKVFFDLLKTDISLRLNNIDKIPDYIINERESKWNIYLNDFNNNILNINFEQWPPEGTTPTEGWILTTWDQNSPYNDFCPIDPNSGKRSVSGCPAVTMSQILNYHKTINSVFFNDTDDYYHNYINRFWIDNDHEEYDFPSFLELNDYISTLNEHYENEIILTDEDMAALNFACGVAAKQVYSPEGSGTFGVDQAYDAYIKFNCDTIVLLENDDPSLYEKISENIKQALPVHLAVVTPAWDSGHNLVIDGYNTDEYYHLNFGWGGPNDAWYLLPDEIPYGLTVIEGVIVDILKNESGSDLNCNGKLNWIDVSPGETLYGNFTVENIGISGSLLDWKIESIPEWGEWTITPSEGFDLSPEDDLINVEVTVIAPSEKGKNFIGGIKIQNMESSGDNYYIQVSLTTPKITNNLFNFMKLIRNIELHFQILKFI
jgi:hypothetical protein